MCMLPWQSSTGLARSRIVAGGRQDVWARPAACFRTVAKPEHIKKKTNSGLDVGVAVPLEFDQGHNSGRDNLASLDQAFRLDIEAV